MQENWIIKIDKNLIIYWLFTTKSRCFFVWVDPNFRGALGLTWGQKWHSFVMLQNKKGISSKCLSLAQNILWLEIFFRGRNSGPKKHKMSITSTYVISTYKYNMKKHCKLFEALMENQIFFWHSNFLHLIFQYLMHSMLLVLISCGAYQMIVSAVKMGLLIFCGLTFFLLVNFIGDNSIFDIQDFMLQMEG